LATGVVRRHRGTRDQFAGQVQDFAHAFHPYRVRGRPPRAGSADAEQLLEAVVGEALAESPSSFTTTGRRTSCGCSRSSSFHSASLPGDLRLSGSWRQVVEDLLTRASKPPALPAHSTRVSGEGLLSR